MTEGDLWGSRADNLLSLVPQLTLLSFFFLLSISIVKKPFQRMVVGLKQNENEALFSTSITLGLLQLRLSWTSSELFWYMRRFPFAVEGFSCSQVFHGPISNAL
jgi:hypothetical protein